MGLRSTKWVSVGSGYVVGWSIGLSEIFDEYYAEGLSWISVVQSPSPYSATSMVGLLYKLGCHYRIEIVFKMTHL